MAQTPADHNNMVDQRAAANKNPKPAPSAKQAPKSAKPNTAHAK